MNVDFEGGEVLVLLSEDTLNVVGVASSITGFNTLIRDEHEKVNQQVIEWAFTRTKNDSYNIYVTVLFDGGDQKENHFFAKKFKNYN